MPLVTFNQGCCCQKAFPDSSLEYGLLKTDTEWLQLAIVALIFHVHFSFMFINKNIKVRG